MRYRAALKDSLYRSTPVLGTGGITVVFLTGRYPIPSQDTYINIFNHGIVIYLVKHLTIGEGYSNGGVSLTVDPEKSVL